MPATALRLEVRTRGMWQLNCVVLSAAVARCIAREFAARHGFVSE